MKNRALFILIALTAFYGTLLATGQQPDRIIYKGKEYRLNSNPLEAYFKQFPDKRPKSGLINTSLWRGYIATFEVIDSSIFVVDISIEVYDKENKLKKKSVFDSVFPGQKAVRLDWFTGILVLPYGNIVNYVHMGYASTFENYILLEVDAGTFSKSRELDASGYVQFRDKQFEMFKKTPEYSALLKSLRDKGESIEAMESFLKIYVIDYTATFLDEP